MLYFRENIYRVKYLLCETFAQSYIFFLRDEDKRK